MIDRCGHLSAGRSNDTWGMMVIRVRVARARGRVPILDGSEEPK